MFSEYYFPAKILKSFCIDQGITINIYLLNNIFVSYYYIKFISVIFLDSKVTCSGIKSTKPNSQDSLLCFISIIIIVGPRKANEFSQNFQGSIEIVYSLPLDEFNLLPQIDL